MRTDITRLLKNNHSEVIVASLVGELLESDGRTEPCSPSSDNADVDLVSFTLNRCWAARMLIEATSTRAEGL